MKIRIRSRNVEMTSALRTHVERRVGLALARFGERIDRVIVRFSDAEGYGGASARRCQVDVGLSPRRVRAEDTDVDSFAAVDHATDRVSRSVARALELEPAIDEGRIAPGTSAGSRT